MRNESLTLACCLLLLVWHGCSNSRNEVQEVAGKQAVSKTCEKVSKADEKFVRIVNEKEANLDTIDFPKRITVINIHNVEKINLESLARFPSLGILSLDRMDLGDVSSLRKLTCLKELSFCGSKVKKLDTLCELGRLEYLVVADTEVAEGEIEKLKRCIPGLKVLRTWQEFEDTFAGKEMPR